MSGDFAFLAGRAGVTALRVSAVLALLSALALASPDVWEEIAGPPRGTWPEPLDELVWRDDLADAFDEARRTGRPLFVTLRCLPCEQCADFDKDVLEGGPELTPLLKRFITVRLVDMRTLDLRLLDVTRFQDLDLSWWGWALSPDGRTYGIYGGRDEISDTTRISVTGLANTLRRVLDHHSDPRRAAWGVDGPPTGAAGGEAFTPTHLDGYDAWVDDHSQTFDARGGASCLHCHEVAEILRQPAIDGGAFDKHTDFDDWPFPENVGLALDRDHGLEVRAVTPGSAAARIGMGPGDELVAAGGRRLFGETDFRGVLHRASRGPARIPVVWRRGEDLRRGILQTGAGWRAHDMGWRKSVAEAALGAIPGFAWPLATSADERRRLGLGEDVMAVKPFFGASPSGVAWEAGLRTQHVIVGVNGNRPNVDGRPFMVWFRLHFEPGDPVELEVLTRNGTTRKIEYTVPTS